MVAAVMHQTALPPIEPCSPTEIELILAVQHYRSEQPSLGALKILQQLRTERNWALGEKRLKKVMKEHDSITSTKPTEDNNHVAPLTPPPTPPKILASLAANHEASAPRPKGTRGRVRTAKPIASTSHCFQTAKCEHPSHQDSWLPGKIRKVRVHLDYLHSLAPPSGNSLLSIARLHVHVCERTGREYVLSPEVCRAIWPRLDSRVAHLAHSMYTPCDSTLIFDSDSEDEHRLVGCPQALKKARCTFLARRGEVEKIWVVQPSMLDQPDGVRREIRIEFGAECHSNSPSRITPIEVPAVVGKGKARQEDGFLVRMNASDVRKVE